MKEHHHSIEPTQESILQQVMEEMTTDTDILSHDLISESHDLSKEASPYESVSNSNNVDVVNNDIVR